jgi:hypothetical protein
MDIITKCVEGVFWTNFAFWSTVHIYNFSHAVAQRHVGWTVGSFLLLGMNCGIAWVIRRDTQEFRRKYPEK